MIQHYKTQSYIHGQTIPVRPGGASVSYPRNYQIPSFAGNYWQMNYVEGITVPQFSLNYALLDGATNTCPCDTGILNAFLTRSNDSAHDVTAIATPKFFDGASGWSFPYCKPAGFTIRGGKAQGLVSMEATYMCYQPHGSSDPSAVTTAISAYTAFSGTPISFQHCSFFNGASYNTPLLGVVDWAITFSNNLTPDMSSDSTTGQKPLPINVNAGQMNVSFSVTFNADASVTGNHMSAGDTFTVKIASGSISSTISLPCVLPEDDRNRNNAAPRVVRTYSGTAVGTSNTVAPIVVSA